MITTWHQFQKTFSTVWRRYKGCKNRHTKKFSCEEFNEFEEKTVTGEEEG